MLIEIMLSPVLPSVVLSDSIIKVIFLNVIILSINMVCHNAHYLYAESEYMNRVIIFFLCYDPMLNA
jgi:hypothetical protein